ncbi:MAG: SDR family NAD(P)-dependent oxidoreductase [Ktedonobacteraceae bacterium]
MEHSKENIVEILITGGTGLVGHHLITELQQRGDTVRALVLPSEDTRKLEERGVTVYRGDIREPDTLIEPMRGVDTVFHLAAMQGLWVPIEEYAKVNVTGTENVCRAVLKTGVRRIVHVSSWTIYGMERGWPLTEDVPPAPRNDPYWITKAQGDLLVQRMIAEDHLPAAIIRPGTIFGVGDRLNFGRTADKIRAGKGLILGSGRNSLPLVYVTDVVQGLLLCADHDNALGQAFNITNDQSLTQEEFLHAIAQELDVPLPRLHIPYAAAYAIAYAAERVVPLNSSKHPIVTRHGVTLYGTDNRHSIDKARTELGYEPRVSIREGVHLACDWYRQQIISAPGVAPLDSVARSTARENVPAI